MQRLPRADFASAADVDAGQRIGFEIARGEEVPGAVIKVSDTAVWLDFSYPLAGLDLIIDVEILDVTSRP
ncbi:MAG: hypothetical protein BMS9Abin10_0472 [Gammaproteobacteria bacterium]|nr:MAG: hypothetical protein BMS9Abin10_0472 [Gammaproteobacteria bacterium]